jgi:hypothetical protein
MTMTEAEIEGLTRFIVRHAVRQADWFLALYCAQSAAPYCHAMLRTSK